MTGLFGTLNTSSSGMRAQQAALQTTSHNLSNMNTHGYSRQRVTMSTAFPQSMAGIGQMGTGVQISGVIRVSDEYITEQLQNELSSLTQHENISDVMGQLEAIFNEPSDSGISQQISDFFVSWGNLGSSSETKTSKTMVVKQSQTFMDTVNHLANQIDNLSKDTVKQVEQEVKDFNSITEQLKGLNDQIFNATVKGEHPNDLYDSQDRLVGQLKDIAGVTVEKRDQYGRMMVSLNGKNGKSVDIVTASEFKELTVKEANPKPTGTNPDYFEFKIKDPSDKEKDAGELVTIGKGSIKGYDDAYVAVVEKQEDLDKYISNFALAVNIIMTDRHSHDKIPFFTFGSDGEVNPDEVDNPAKKISVNKKLIKNPDLLVTGKDFGNTIAGDGSRAKAIADLQHTTLVLKDRGEVWGAGDKNNWNYNSDTMSFEGQESGSSLFNHYNDIITDMGITKRQADNMVANQTDLVSLLEQRHESVSGVDLNEEVVDMIRYQSAYQANARVISAINDMLDTLINRMGV